ncbi:AMP-binding protein [Sorangium sp. So ce1153]|uniref:AMP-binding protein n=1 Tax=Sorangium sp. So ce1153 TaxID=3133333 RepID=UPI003F61E4ED
MSRAPSARTVAGLLRARAEATPDRFGFYHKQQGEFVGWSWAEYWRRACAAASGLTEAGVRPGDRVLLLVTDVEVAVPCLFGVWVLGAVPIQVGVPYRLTDVAAFLGELRRTAARVGARALVVSSALLGFAQGDGGGEVNDVSQIVQIAAEPLLDARLADLLPGSLPDPDGAPGPALIQLTSGSTGHPRGVVIPHERLMLHLDAMSQRLPVRGEGAGGVSWLPLHHDMGLVGGLLFPLFNDFPVHMLSPLEFRTRPFSWLAEMSSIRGAISLGPPSAYSICIGLARRAVEAGLDLSAWRCAMIGAEPISPALLRRFADAFAPSGFRAEAFFPVYGLAEATVAVTFPDLLAAPRALTVDRVLLEREGRVEEAAPGPLSLELVGVGRPIPRTEIRIVDAGRSPVPERTVGEIEVRSETLMEGYFDEPEATAEALVDGWLRTGDLGFLDGGALFVTGRKKEVIIKGGHTMIPAVIEDIAARVDGIRAGCVVAVGLFVEERQTESVYVVAETRADVSEHAGLAERVREALRANGVTVDHVVLVPPGDLPKTTSGKLRRREVAERLRAGAAR